MTPLLLQQTKPNASGSIILSGSDRKESIEIPTGRSSVVAGYVCQQCQDGSVTYIWPTGKHVMTTFYVNPFDKSKTATPKQVVLHAGWPADNLLVGSLHRSAMPRARQHDLRLPTSRSRYESCFGTYFEDSLQ